MLPVVRSTPPPIVRIRERLLEQGVRPEVLDSIFLRHSAKLSLRAMQIIYSFFSVSFPKNEHCSTRTAMDAEIGVRPTREDPLHEWCGVRNWGDVIDLVITCPPNTFLHGVRLPRPRGPLARADIRRRLLPVIRKTQDAGRALQFFVDGRGQRGGASTALPPCLRRSVLDVYGRIKTVVAGLACPTVLAVHDTALLPLYIGLGSDSRSGLVALWQRIASSQMPSLLAECASRNVVLNIVADGGALLAFTATSSQRCPICLEDVSQYRLAGSSRDPVSIFTRLECCWFGLSIPWHRVIWAPGHCFAHTVEYFFEGAYDVIALRRGEVAASEWMRELSVVSGVRALNGRGCLISWGSTKTLYHARRQVRLVRSGSSEVDSYLALLLLAMELWFGEQRCVDAFSTCIQLLRMVHIRLFTTMQPSIHNLFDHLPRQWSLSGDRDFPDSVSEETGEKVHRGHNTTWIHSLMTVVSQLGEETGLDLTLRESLLAFVLPWLCDVCL